MNMSEGERQQTPTETQTDTQRAMVEQIAVEVAKAETLLVLKKVANFFKFPLDKPHKVWYNKDVPKRNETKFKGRHLIARLEFDTMSKKMTIAETFAEIIDTYDLSDEHKAFLLDRIDKASRKSNGERKPTAKQVENAKVAEAVYAEMEPNRAYTVSEMMKVLTAFNSIEGVSASYCNAIVKKLKDSGKVVRNEVKGRAYFTKVEG